MNLRSIIRPSVWELAAYSSARSDYSGAATTTMLDANENPYGRAYSRYPDPKQTQLRQRLATLRKVHPDQILVGNGSDEIIDLLMRLTCQPRQDRILTLDPSYGMYSVCAAVNEVPLDMVPLEEDLTVNTQAVLDAISTHKLILLCSPNNPNGDIIADSTIEQILAKAKGLVVIDEAYIDFTDRDSWLSRLSDYPQLVVLQTFSKSWAAAGLRVGMAYADKSLVELLHKIKPPYNVSAPAQEAALAVLDDFDILRKQINELIEQRQLLADALTKLPIVQKVFPSQANFLLVRFDDALAVYDLLKYNGIIVRDRSRHTHCQGCLRITIGTPAQNKLLLDTLKNIG